MAMALAKGGTSGCETVKIDTRLEQLSALGAALRSELAAAAFEPALLEKAEARLRGLTSSLERELAKAQALSAGTQNQQKESTQAHEEEQQAIAKERGGGVIFCADGGSRRRERAGAL